MSALLQFIGYACCWGLLLGGSLSAGLAVAARLEDRRAGADLRCAWLHRNRHVRYFVGGGDCGVEAVTCGACGNEWDRRL